MKLAIRILLLAAAVAVVALVYQRFVSPEAIPVVLATVEVGRVEATIANTRAGTVKACRRSRLSPATGGQVAQLDVREGDRTVAGQVLMVLWNDDLRARLALAESETEAAAARMRESCLNSEMAAREARRLRRLAEQRAIAEDALDRAVTQASASEAACRAAGAAHDVAQSQAQAVAAALELTYLKAPFDGIVAEVNAEIGEYVTPSPPGIPTPPAVDLIADGCVFVSAPIDEVDAPAVAVGMDVCVELDAFPARRCSGRVRRIAPYVLDREKQARTLEVEVEIQAAEEAEGLLPGYTADVEIIAAARDGVLRVPTEAVLERRRVLVYRETDGMLETREFEPGIANWRYTEVRSGLVAGERVALSIDREGVREGARVVPEEAQGP